MADYLTQFSCVFPVGPGNAKAALALYEQMQAELDADDMGVGFVAEAHEPGNDNLWLWDGDGNGDIENVIAFAFKCAAAFNLHGLWGFPFSLSCSRARLDGFGGGAHLIDLGRRRTVSWVDTEHWLGQEIARFSEPTSMAAGASKAPGLCASCSHWDTEPYAESPHVRRCKRVPQWWSATTWDEDTFDRVLTAEEKDTLAFANDGSCYAATLLTRPEFGCVMHEARAA